MANATNGTAWGAQLECLRCGHKWRARGEKPPRTCAHCNSPYWDCKPRRKKGGEKK